MAMQVRGHAIPQLPGELELTLFQQFLDKGTLKNCRLVNKAWKAMAESQEQAFGGLPLETENHIFGFLDVKDLVSCTLVNRSWKKQAERQTKAWKEFIDQTSFYDGYGSENAENLKRRFSLWMTNFDHEVKSHAEVLQKLEGFLNRLRLHEKGAISFTFLFNPSVKIGIEMGCGSVPRNCRPEWRETCLVTRKIPEDEIHGGEGRGIDCDATGFGGAERLDVWNQSYGSQDDFMIRIDGRMGALQSEARQENIGRLKKIASAAIGALAYGLLRPYMIE